MWKTLAAVRRQCFKDRVILRPLQARQVASSSDQFTHPLLSAAAKGDLSELDRALNNASASDVNLRDERGWTALMFAAQNGHHLAVNRLLDKNADSSVLNRTGQSAYDLAVFWQHKQTAKLLRDRVEKPKTFASEVLQRHSSRRSEKQWLTELMEKPSSVFIATHFGKPLVTRVGQRRLQLSRFAYSQLKPFVDDRQTIFLGTIEADQLEATAYFSADLSSVSEDEVIRSFPGTEVAHIFQLVMMKGLDRRLISLAKPLIDWHKYKFCPECGNETKMATAGYRKVCVNDNCSTHKRIQNVSYPRVDPTIICSIASSDGQRLLLAHKRTHPVNMYSCVAGFVEPGETMEEACGREVEEEVGLVVNDICYHSSESWPAPSCLMVGFMTKATDKETIKLDTDELEDGRWFSREEVVQMLTHQHPKLLFVPPLGAIAHRLIKTWVMESAFRSVSS